MSVMPKRMQVMKLKDELHRMGISSDLHDIEAHVDASISYPENARNILKRFKNTSNSHTKSKQNKFGVGNVDFSYASKFHDARSPRAKAQDNAHNNKHTYSEKEISKKPSLLDSWFKRPGASDIYGIDGFGNPRNPKKIKRSRKK